MRPKQEKKRRRLRKLSVWQKLLLTRWMNEAFPQEKLVKLNYWLQREWDGTMWKRRSVTEDLMSLSEKVNWRNPQNVNNNCFKNSKLYVCWTKWSSSSRKPQKVKRLWFHFLYFSHQPPAHGLDKFLLQSRWQDVRIFDYLASKMSWFSVFCCHGPFDNLSVVWQ